MPMEIRIFRRSLFFLLSFLMFFGCATIPEIINLEQDESFTHDEIVGSMMGVGGVVSVANDIDESKSSKYAGILQKSFLTVRKEFVVLPVEEVIQWLGSDRYQTMLHHYRYKGLLDSDFVVKLKSSSIAFRYLLLVRIIENETTETRERCPRTEIPPQWDSKGNPVVKEIAVELTATRRMTVSLDIYDLSKGILAWSGMINESKSKQRTVYFEKKDEDLGRKFALIPVRAFLEVTLQPSAPPTDKLLHKIFKAFAQYMP
ncbi:MAG: hypothetical protein SWH54_06130 [Thermodesulfobacteriota bacterium]|nr:hypothetical protein [Thermodesulfobacteriota bacterium]